MIEACPVNLECRVIKKLTIQHRQIFISEVLQTYISEQFITMEDGKISVMSLEALDPILYGLDNRYYTIGKSISIGYQEVKPSY